MNQTIDFKHFKHASLGPWAIQYIEPELDEPILVIRIIFDNEIQRASFKKDYLGPSYCGEDVEEETDEP